MKLYCLKYNNYYNRIVKKETTLANYLSKDPDYIVISNISFNPGDGVNTTQVVNTTVIGDYAIYATDTGDIKSRWFIIEAKRERTGQYTLTLRRDVIVDSYEYAINAPCFIEKATLLSNDPMIFNNEDMTFNQIKKAEYQLKDESECPWVIGYIPQDVFQQDTEINIVYSDAESTDIITVNDITTWDYYDYCNLNPNQKVFKGNTDDSYFKLKAQVSGQYSAHSAVVKNTCNYIVSTGGDYSNDNYRIVEQLSPLVFIDGASTLENSKRNTLAKKLWKNFISTPAWFNNVNSYLSLISSDDLNTFKALDGKQIKDTTTNNVYDIRIVKTKYTLDNTALVTLGSTLGQRMDATLNKDILESKEAGGNTYSIDYGYSNWYIELIPSQGITAKTTLLASNKRYHPSGSQFDMICMPYSDILKIYSNGQLKGQADSKLAIQAMTQITLNTGKDTVYDVQLVPFCPVREYIKPRNVVWNIGAVAVNTIDNTTSDASVVIKTTYTADGMMWAEVESDNMFTLNIYNKNNGLLLKTYSGSIFEVTATGFSFSNIEETLFDQTWEAYTESDTVIEIVLKQGSEWNTDGKAVFSVLYDYNGRTINPPSLDYGSNYVSEIKVEENVIGHIFYCSKSSFSFDIKTLYSETNELLNISDICKVTNPKIQNETEVWRLVSPNYNGQFEFSVAKNNGVNLFNVDVNYRPFDPYIHINPDFNKLYGKDFNDARGLILGGDYSLPQVTSSWANYQQNNKNYQKIFDRQIENIEVQNKYQRINEITGAVSGTISGAHSGAAFGPVGAVVGGITSAAGGIADYYINEQLRTEALNYKKDMFGYQLGNIQAMPQSITKISPYTINNKLFPILEYYTCTDEELQALKNKLKYNGMTVMRIGTISEFIGNHESYIKGQLIRLEDIHEDFHYVNSLAEEIYKGAFF